MTSASRPDALRPAGHLLRAVRAVAAAVVCVTAAAVGHHSAGGALAGEAVLAVFAGSSVVAWLLAARRVRPEQLLGLLVLCQVCVHLAASTHDMSMGAAMIAAHVAATGVSVVALARGERFVWEIAHRLGLHLRPMLQLSTVVPAARPAPPTDTPRVLRDVQLTHSLWLRGPPVALA